MIRFLLLAIAALLIAVVVSITDAHTSDDTVYPIPRAEFTPRLPRIAQAAPAPSSSNWAAFSSASVNIVPLQIRSSDEVILSIDKTGYITVRGKPATDAQIVEALREFAMLQTQPRFK